MKQLRRIVSVLLIAALCAACACSLAENAGWICPECGSANEENFCLQCGAKKPESIVCPACGKEYAPDSGAVFCGNCGAKLTQPAQPAQASVRLEGDGFATPEEAVAFYLEGLKNLDYNQMLKAFAWETQAEHFSTEARVRRVKAYTMGMKPRMPSDGAFLRSAALYSLLSAQTDVIYTSLEAYILGEDNPADKTGSVTLKTDEDFEAFWKKFDNGRLEKLSRMGEIVFPTPDQVTENRFSMENNQKNYAKQNAAYGADETADVPAVADLGGEVLFVAPTAARYGDRWYLVSTNSMTTNIMGIPYSKTAFICAEGSLSSLGLK